MLRGLKQKANIKNVFLPLIRWGNWFGKWAIGLDYMCAHAHVYMHMCTRTCVCLHIHVHAFTHAHATHKWRLPPFTHHSARAVTYIVFHVSIWISSTAVMTQEQTCIFIFQLIYSSHIPVIFLTLKKNKEIMCHLLLLIRTIYLPNSEAWTYTINCVLNARFWILTSKQYLLDTNNIFWSF